MTDLVRAYYKRSNTNVEVKGPFYELSTYAAIHGAWNFQSLALGFTKGEGISSMTFRPIDPSKPIVLAVSNLIDNGFMVIDEHLDATTVSLMRNYKALRSNEFLIDCQNGELGKRDSTIYWSITSKGLTFAYGGKTFPDTWMLRDCDLLCAFIGGELTANQLRMHAYRANREEVKEQRREERIRNLAKELHILAALSKAANELRWASFILHNSLVGKLITILDSNSWPLIKKSTVRELLRNHVLPKA